MLAPNRYTINRPTEARNDFDNAHGKALEQGQSSQQVARKTVKTDSKCVTDPNTREDKRECLCTWFRQILRYNTKSTIYFLSDKLDFIEIKTSSLPNMMVRGWKGILQTAEPLSVHI